jgi:hypothetical protein
MNGARAPIPPELTTPEMDMLVGLRSRVMELWEERELNPHAGPPIEAVFGR